ncbi:MAG: hypothetical protein B7Z26_03260 [Asticcacaulis sp. 32-58-5]|nr:MAG: hypothetical protein B7Z26_03260 [Asticcacaulis sp. 32-58-5]
MTLSMPVLALRGLVLIVSIWLFVFLLGPYQTLPFELGMSDKEAHVLTFYCFASLLLLSTNTTRRGSVLLFCITISAVAEVLQTSTGRDGNVADFLASSLGSTMAVLPTLIGFMRQKFKRNVADNKHLQIRL